MVPFIFISFSFFSCFFLSLSFFFLFRATPVAYGSFWTRDWIGAHATDIEMLDPSCICDLHYSSLWCQILNPLSGARGWTGILMDTSWVHYRWTTMETPYISFSMKCIPYFFAHSFIGFFVFFFLYFRSSL